MIPFIAGSLLKREQPLTIISPVLQCQCDLQPLILMAEIIDEVDKKRKTKV